MTWIDVARFLLALVFVVSLMGGLWLVLRHFGLQGGNFLPGGREGKRRLRIVEVLPLDSRRRAVLLARDNVQHLVILGANGEVVVETDIPSPPSGAGESTSHGSA